MWTRQFTIVGLGRLGNALTCSRIANLERGAVKVFDNAPAPPPASSSFHWLLWCWARCRRAWSPAASDVVKKRPLQCQICIEYALSKRCDTLASLMSSARRALSVHMLCQCSERDVKIRTHGRFAGAKAQFNWYVDMNCARLVCACLPVHLGTEFANSLRC